MTGRTFDQQSTDELRADIAQTRARVAGEVEALGQKLTPENVSREAKHAVKRRVREETDKMKYRAESAGRSLVSGARGNPIPMALIGIGTGWLIWDAMRKRRGKPEEQPYERFERGHEEPEAGAYSYSTAPGATLGSEPYYGDEGDLQPYETGQAEPHHEGALRSAKERASALADRAKQSMSSTGKAVRERGSAFRDRALDQGRHVRERARQSATWARDEGRGVWTDNPLAVGAMAFAAGLGLGLMLPATSAENRWMGGTRERFVNQLRQQAKHAGEIATSTAQETFEAAQQSARRHVEGMTGGGQQQQQAEPSSPPQESQQQAQSPSPGDQQYEQRVTVHQVKPVGSETSQPRPPVQPGNGSRPS